MEYERKRYGRTSVSRSFLIDKEVMEKLQEIATKEKTSVNAVVSSALKKFVEAK